MITGLLMGTSPSAFYTSSHISLSILMVIPKAGGSYRLIMDSLSLSLSFRPLVR